MHWSSHSFISPKYQTTTTATTRGKFSGRKKIHFTIDLLDRMNSIQSRAINVNNDLEFQGETVKLTTSRGFSRTRKKTHIEGNETAAKGEKKKNCIKILITGFWLTSSWWSNFFFRYYTGLRDRRFLKPESWMSRPWTSHQSQFIIITIFFHSLLCLLNLSITNTSCRLWFKITINQRGFIVPVVWLF